MARLRYRLRPLQHGLLTDYPSLQIGDTFSPWLLNCKVDQHSMKKRWGYSLDRTLPSQVLNIATFQKSTGERYCVYLTDTDAMIRKAGSGETWQYITDTYTTGTVASMNGPKTVITGNAGTDWNTSGVTAGDKFILDDDHSPAQESNITPWATVLGVGGATTLNLSPAYTGTHTSGTYKIRKVYTVPANERWTYANVADQFCFTNGYVDVQTWDGSGYATALDSTNAKNARYCIEYADRLILADVYVGGVRSPTTVQWCGITDVTSWDPATDISAGSSDMMETEDYVTGLGKAGGNLVVFKRDSFIITTKTGETTKPFDFGTQRRGIGCVAPYSIVEIPTVAGLAWLGRDDWYKLDSDTAEEFSHEQMRFKFFDMTEPAERFHTWGFLNYDEHEVIWTCVTTSGKYQFVYDLKHQEWYPYKYSDDIVGAGLGAT